MKNSKAFVSASTGIRQLESIAEQYEHTAATIRELVVALRGVMSEADKTPKPRKAKKAKRSMSAEAREKLRQAALARWAAKKDGAGNGKQAQKRPTQAKPTGQKAKSQPLAAVTGESAA